jgi:hypothetical protein
VELASVGSTVDTSKLDALIAQLPAAQAAIDALANPVPSSSTATASARPQL